MSLVMDGAPLSKHTASTLLGEESIGNSFASDSDVIIMSSCHSKKSRYLQLLSDIGFQIWTSIQVLERSILVTPP